MEDSEKVRKVQNLELWITRLHFENTQGEKFQETEKPNIFLIDIRFGFLLIFLIFKKTPIPTKKIDFPAKILSKKIKLKAKTQKRKTI